MKKPSTPKERNIIGNDVKSKEKESSASVFKDSKIKFSLKPNESSEESPRESMQKQQPSNQQQQVQPQQQQSAQNSNATGTNAIVSISNNNGRTSSCVIDLKTVWFNFAAPPSAPITRKIDFTR